MSVIIQVVRTDSGRTVVWDGGTKVDVIIPRDEERGRQTMCGLCGNNDGNNVNDYMKKSVNGGIVSFFFNFL